MGFGLDTAGQGALAGLSVIDLGEGTAGPYAAKLLGDFGAEVVKVEGPAGDLSRRRGPFPDGRPDPNASGLYQYLNTNKLGVVLDLDAASSRPALAALLARADVLVTTLPRSRLAAMGLAPPDLRRHYPHLVIATISPFGGNGPWADRKGDELTAFAASGLAYSTPGMPDAAEDLETEPPLHPACFVAETATGLATAIATMSAILGGEGYGCHIDIGLQGTIASMQIRDLPPVSYSGATHNRLLNPTTVGRMPNFYLPCRDGYVTVAAPMEVHWDRLLEAMGKPDWAFQEEFRTVDSRMVNWVALRLHLIGWTMTMPGAEVQALANKYQLPMFSLHSIEKMAESDHVRARNSLVDVVIGGRPARMPGAPAKMHGAPWEIRRPAPRLGEHNDMVFSSLNAVSP